MKILPIDFDNAVKQRWSRTTCIAAQAIKRITGRFPNLAWDDISSQRVWGNASNETINSTVLIFDKHFVQPGDETKPELQQLRASLPIEI